MCDKNNIKKENCCFKDEDLSNSSFEKKKVSVFVSMWEEFDVELLKERIVESRETSKKRKLVRF